MIDGADRSTPDVSTVERTTDAAREGDNLGRQTASGLNWTVLASFVRAFSSFGIGVVLARLLPPQDFGVAAAAYVVTSFVYVLSEGGLGSALIQRQVISRRHVRVCHTLSALLALAAAGLVYLSANPAARFLDEPAVAGVLQVLAFGSLFSGFGLTSRALLTRDLRFRLVVQIELVASILGYGVVALTMAAMGYGYWSLVVGTLVQTVLSSLFSYAAVRHELSPALSRSEVSDLLGFGAGVNLVEIANFFAVKGDYLMIGRVLDSASLGYYSRAFTLMELPMVVFGGSLSRVLFPAAARVQDEPARFRRAYMMALSVSVALSLSMSVSILVFAPEIISVLYGSVWAPAIPLLQVLCAFGVFRVSYNTASAFLKASGKVYELLWCTVAFGFLVVGGSWWAVTTAGLTAVPWAVGGAIMVMWLMVVSFANRAAAVPLREFCRSVAWAILPGALLGVLLFGIAYGLRSVGTQSLVILAIGGALGILGTLGVLMLQARRFDHVVLNDLMKRVFPFHLLDRRVP
jgi:O-antigen/teichoic acid export membrane protein